MPRNRLCKYAVSKLVGFPHLLAIYSVLNFEMFSSGLIFENEAFDALARSDLAQV